jgi:Glycosyl hydrolases family 31
VSNAAELPSRPKLDWAVHKLWRPKRVLVTPAALEWEHGRGILERAHEGTTFEASCYTRGGKPWQDGRDGGFTPVMRTHEGNRPRDNLQIDQDADVPAHFVRMTRIYVHLVPYLKSLVAEASTRGLPVQRPLSLHFEDDARSYAVQDAYLYGPDVLVAPVWQAGKPEWSAYLPQGADWVHVWSGRTFTGGQEASVDAPFGQPPVFYRAGSEFSELFASLRNL